MRSKPTSFDAGLFSATVVLTIGGLLILASASMVLSATQAGSIWYYALKQVLFGGIIGGVLLFFTQWINYRIWRKLAAPLMLVSFVLLALLFVPSVGYSAGGARRWLALGPISFQPSEFLKLAFVVYLASWLDARRREISSISYGLLPFSLMLGIVGMFLIMQPDIGTLGVIIATSAALYFVGGGRTSQIATLGAFGSVIFYFLIQLAPYRLARLTVFLNPGHDPQGIGYQITQALIAIGSGGLGGQGFGKSIQKHNFLPEPMGDSIFAVYAEEMGFIGAVLLIAIFVFFIWRGFVIARNAPDVFGKLLAAGIIAGVGIQAFINMAAISGLLPLTGIPLPFVSFGGTSLAITLASIGIVLNISKHMT